MHVVLIDNAWTKIRKRLRSIRGKRSLAIAYVTKEHLSLKSGDTLVCDASYQSIATGQTSKRLLKKLHDRGVVIRSSPGLHAKIGIVGDHAFIGSANMSGASEDELHESVLLTTAPFIKSCIYRAFCELESNSKKLGDLDIKRIQDIRVIARPRSLSKRRSRIDDGADVIWLSSAKIVEKWSARTQRNIDRGISRIRRRTGMEEYDDDWYSPYKRSPLGEGIRKGHRIMLVTNNGGRTVVQAPREVIALQPDGKHVIAFFAPVDDRSVPWRSFKAWADKKGFRISKHPMRLLKAGERDLINGYSDWK